MTSADTEPDDAQTHFSSAIPSPSMIARADSDMGRAR
jgi:hypothetical protein